MSNHNNKRHCEDLPTSSRAIKRVRYQLQMETTPDIDDDVTNIRSPSPNALITQYTRGLLELVEAMDFEVKRLRDKQSEYEEERERARIHHEQEVERYCDRIDALEDELRYQRVLVEVTTGEVDQLNDELEQQKTHIREVLERARI
ncbi:hypothetical protein BDR06DRAFT_977861 [Suillus hirtellus]|nr:hypothetical protein BDR06DRAFT_977861 [Suillus hirtellus]